MARTKVVPTELAGPLDRAVRGLFGASWGKARAWIEGGKVRVGGRDRDRSDGARRRREPRSPSTRRPEGRGRKSSSDDDVVYADAQVIVVAKPPGLSTVPYDDTENDTLDAARARRGSSARGLAPRGARPTLGIVHRLDKETSGLVVFTRTWLAKQALTAQFRHHTVHRRYLAIAHGDVPARTLRSFLVEDRGDGLRGSARGASRRPPADAREAITHVERLEALAERRWSRAGSRRDALTRSGST